VVFIQDSILRIVLRRLELRRSLWKDLSKKRLARGLKLEMSEVSKWPKTRTHFVNHAFIFCTECAIRNVQETQEGLKLKGIHKFLLFVDTLIC
jgi:hypothetical protein